MKKIILPADIKAGQVFRELIITENTNSEQYIYKLFKGSNTNTNYLVTDYSVIDYGYHIDKVAYYSSTPLVIGESAANGTDELLAPEDLPKK